MADRRRINGPVGGTMPPVFADAEILNEEVKRRTRPSNTARPIYLKTGITPSASGSAYLELQTSSRPGVSGLKLSCTVHGPRSLPRSTPFSPHIILATHVKYAPFATKQRRGYIRDATERDLSIHLETAMRGAIIADRWPKSGVDIIVSVIEGDQDRSLSRGEYDEAWDTMNVLAGCITVASAALVDAGIDCVDTVAGGVAALVSSANGDSKPELVIDPLAAQHDKVLAVCCVAYLPEREEITNLWFKGDLPATDPILYTELVQKGVLAAQSADRVLIESLKETIAQDN
ncbi:3' exoribonuclease family, domain 1-domain-containing protein [Coniella lustricola]|uniref:3' exoribonuclease family, domain 1-domain-containing protein n=1 Tax=Coniella lustricola TaxID=2025994 RepID=A0A2T3AKV9_9PEZI|nr:3' exoribonuclease family, domain 1-domain-containing protein [Coniella lustricola]